MIAGPAAANTVVIGKHLDAVAAALAGHGVSCRVTRPAGTPLFAGPSIGEIARQISNHGHHVPAPPDAVHRPDEPRQP